MRHKYQKLETLRENGGAITSLTDFKVTKTPRHVAIIMDGNGRWAGEQGLSRIQGHRAGAKVVKEIVESCIRRGVQYLTLFSFSTENWKRGTGEVNSLMSLLKEYLESELPDMLTHGVRLRTIGDTSELPLLVQKGLKRNIELSKKNTKLDLILALNYGAREELVRAAQILSQKAMDGQINPKEITSEILASCLWSEGIPDPDLLIRTSGELRISNFLLWQLAYTEIVITSEYWPEFTDEIFERCLIEYAKRERRFGFTSEQAERGEHVGVADKLGYSVA
jgi:undecaprenyl diphosphate synthase